MSIMENSTFIIQLLDDDNVNNTTAETNDENISENLKEITRIIRMVYAPIFIIYGTCFNILTFIVMRRGSMKEVSTCFYMSILALADTGKMVVFLHEYSCTG